MSTKGRKFRLSDDAASAVDRIAQIRGVSAAEVLRRAIGTKEYLVQALEAGSRILLETPSGALRQVILK